MVGSSPKPQLFPVHNSQCPSSWSKEVIVVNPHWPCLTDERWVASKVRATVAQTAEDVSVGSERKASGHSPTEFKCRDAQP